MNKYWRIGTAMIFALITLASASAPDWSRFNWLLGEWTAEGGGTQQGQGGFSFKAEAGGQVLLRRNFAEYPPQGGRPTQRHDDLMVIYREGSNERAIYWDSEGHTIHYGVAAPSPDIVVFVSDDPSGPRFRLSYHRVPAGLEGMFEIAPPNDREQFTNHLTWKARRAP